MARVWGTSQDSKGQDYQTETWPKLAGSKQYYNESFLFTDILIHIHDCEQDPQVDTGCAQPGSWSKQSKVPTLFVNG